jgi:beta-glucosidase
MLTGAAIGDDLNLQEMTMLSAFAKRSVSLLAIFSCCAGAATAAPPQPEIESRHIPLLHIGSLSFRDLNRDGKLEPFEDWRLTAAARAADLITNMTLEEKAGAVMHGNFPEIAGEGGLSTSGYRFDDLRPLLLGAHVTSYLTRLAVPPAVMAQQNNLVQEMAEEGRLGIPVTISTDPRHHFLYITGQSSNGRGYSQWPETIGFAALGDPKLVQTFAEIARREYRATGIQQALSPQVDLYTEPRWARGYGGFGSIPSLSRSMAQAYVQGFQGGHDGLQRNGVLATIKHWVAYGATVNGFDAHNAYGKFSRVDKRSFQQQIEPFLGGFDAGVGAVMPTYAIVQGVNIAGKPLEPVAGGYSKQLLTTLLRGRYHFNGLVLSDWAITNDCPQQCSAPSSEAPQERTTLGMPWGVEGLSKERRFAKAMNAGVDQFGGVVAPEQIVAAIRESLISSSRLDEAVKRVMIPKFEMGLFDNPYVDVSAVSHEVNTPEVATLSAHVQAQAQVLLKETPNVLPLSRGTHVYASGIDESAMRAIGLVPVKDPKDAQIALIRLAAPFEKLHPYHFIGGRQHEGRLDFPPGDKEVALIASLKGNIPVVTSIFLDRPAILGSVEQNSSVIIANFGVSDDALLAVLTGKDSACGRLPFELPSTMAAVEAQDPGSPNDSAEPTFRVGAGLTSRCRQPS